MLTFDKDYAIIWQQNGYLFRISIYGAPEAYIEKILKMAESVQPID